MHPFRYERPATIEEAATLLADDAEATLLAGGMTLIPTLKMRLAMPTVLVDIGGIDALRGVRAVDGGFEIGAMTTHDAIARHRELAAAQPALCRLAASIGDPQVRNLGTLGGSLANNDPAADYPAAVLAMNATVVTTTREIAADDFFDGMFQTALQPGEIITAVRFPTPRRAAYSKFANPASRYAIAAVMVADTKSGVRVAVTGAADAVYREAAMEEALNANFAVASLGGIQVDAAAMASDLHADSDYRAHLVGVMARRAVADILD